jgi:hypothetical protein
LSVLCVRLIRLLICSKPVLIGYAFDVAVVERNAVLGAFAATSNGEVVRLAPAGPCHFVEPVGVGPEVVGAGRVHFGFEIAPFVGVHHIDEAEGVVGADEAVVVDRHAAFFTAFCRNQDNTGRTAAAVDGGCRTVLEHIDRLDVVGVDVFEGPAQHTVNHHEWLRIGAQGGEAAKADVEAGIGVAAWRG